MQVSRRELQSRLCQWLLGEAIGLTQLSPSELSVSPIRADALILLAFDQVILHLEFQTQPDPDIPFRMADYRLRGYRRYPKKQMRQVVIYLKPTQSDLVRQTVFALPRTRHEFDVIRLWECRQDDLLRYPGLLPLTILSQTEDKTQTLREIARRIEALPDKGEQSNVAAATSVLAGLVLDKTVIQQILREEIMRGSVIYQDIVEQGIQRERSLILKLLNRQVNHLPPDITAQIQALSIDQLETLGEALLDFTSAAVLVHWLERHQNT